LIDLELGFKNIVFFGFGGCSCVVENDYDRLHSIRRKAVDPMKNPQYCITTIF